MERLFEVRWLVCCAVLLAGTLVITGCRNYEEQDGRFFFRQYGYSIAAIMPSEWGDILKPPVPECVMFLGRDDAHIGMFVYEAVQSPEALFNQLTASNAYMVRTAVIPPEVANFGRAKVVGIRAAYKSTFNMLGRRVEALEVFAFLRVRTNNVLFTYKARLSTDGVIEATLESLLASKDLVLFDELVGSFRAD